MRTKKSSAINDKAIINVLRDELFQWTCERHATNQPLNREILGDKVTDLSIELGLRDFKCSKTWISKFLKKHGFSTSLTSPQGPIFHDYRQWIELMRPYITQYRYKNLFQVDEMGMYHDISPDKIPQSVDNITCENGEDGESRVTILLCCNASGVEKLPPVICGKFENRLPPDHRYQYYANQNAWFTPDVFKVWLSQLNTQMSQLNRKILLLLNRTRVHTLKDAVLSHVTLMFLPKEFPQDLQPLKANIFHCVKIMYRRNFAKKMLQPDFNWTLTDTINSIVNSWDSVPKEFILASFRRTNFRSDNDLLQISCPEWDDLNPGIPFRSYVTFDDNLCVSSSTTRRSKRLADIKTAGNSETCFTRGSSHDGGFRELIELGDSESDEDVVEEVSHSSKITEFDRGLPTPNSYKYTTDGKSRGSDKDFKKAKYSKPEVRELASKYLKGSKEDRCCDRSDLTYCARPLGKTAVLYISDIVKNVVGRVVDNVPDVVGLTSGLKRRAGTGDVVNLVGVKDDVATAPIARKKRREEETDDEDVPNEKLREQTEKRIVGEKAWSDVYEHNFVFGVPEVPQATTSAPADVQTTLLQPTNNSLQKNDDVERKSIFTIRHASSSGPQNE